MKKLLFSCLLFFISCSNNNRILEKVEKLLEENPELKAEPFINNKDNKQRQSGFIKLDAKEIGIDFMHIWDPDPQHRGQLRNSFISAGVAIGDFDNDGLSDIYLTRQKDAGKLYKNLGDFQFKDVTREVGIEPSGMWSTGVTFVDINDDGWLDLFICGFDSPNRLYINMQSRFKESASMYGLDFKGASVVMSFADYDLDGDLDAYLLTNRVNSASDIGDVKIIRDKNNKLRVHKESKELAYFVQPPDRMQLLVPAGQFDYLYRNDNGKFTDVSKEAGISDYPFYGLSATWWDYNNDGWPDIYVANDYMGQDHLFRNNGFNNGSVTFTDVGKTGLPHTPWFSMGSDYSDINNDGRMDFLASDMAGSNHYRDKLSMGSMSGPDSDSWFLNFPTPPQYMRNALYLNTGTSRFMEVAYLSNLAKTDWTWTVKFGDLDNDGFEDVYFTNGMSRDYFNGDLINRSKKFLGSKNGRELELEMWENEKPYRLKNQLYRNVKGLNFKDMSDEWGFDHLGVSTGSAIGDLDGDGDLDIVVNGFEEPPLIYRNEIKKNKSLRIKLVGEKSNNFGIGVKIIVETMQGLIINRYVSNSRGFMSSSEPIVHIGLGQESAAKNISVIWPSGMNQRFNNVPAGYVYTISEPDIDKKNPDLNNKANKNTIFNQNRNVLQKVEHSEKEFDDFKLQKLLPNKLSQLGPGMAWGDIDKDGDFDLFVGGSAGFPSKIFLNEGDGNFDRLNQEPFLKNSKTEDMGALFFDCDYDGDMDLYVVSGGVEYKPSDEVYRDRLYENDGKGFFIDVSYKKLPDLRVSGSVVTAGDIDGDGMVELFVGGRVVPGSYPESPQSYILKNNGNKYIDVTDSFAPGIKFSGMVTSAVFTDVNGDNSLDLMVTYEWGPVKYFQNESGVMIERTNEVGLSERSGWYNSISGADLDKDGDIDYLVGNFGYNSKYQASKDKPEILYYGYFENNEDKNIIEAKFENGICLPHRGLGCSSDAMPSVKENFPTYHDFAVTPLEGIYENALLSAADKYEVNDLTSGILYNQRDIGGKTKFKFVPLPRIAQASPIFGSQINDVNGDGNLDLYVVQNFFGPQRETGNMDGGVSLLMLGDGKGNFKELFPDESGLIVSGDATSLTILDFNNDNCPDYLVGINNSNFISFENKSNKKFIKINIPSLANGRNYLGSRIKVNYKSNGSQIYEFFATNGYLSQSIPIIFVATGDNLKIDSIVIYWPDGSSENLSSYHYSDKDIYMAEKKDR